MAREDLKELYVLLKDSEFRFMPRGTHDMDMIYREVKARFSGLCDDGYLCSENCKNGHLQPEWNHTVRKALESLKRKSVAKDVRKKFWIFR
jgi:hypothetical protein